MPLIFISFSLIFVVFAYVVFRIVVRRDYSENKKLTTISYLLETLVFAVHANLIYAALPAKWPFLPPLPHERWITIISAFLTISGALMLLLSWIKLGTKTSFGQNKNKLTTTGLYRFSRNPQLVGYGILLAGMAILYISWMVIIWLLLYVIASAFMIRSEEEFLKSQYRDDYENYCREVSRVLGIKKSTNA